MSKVCKVCRLRKAEVPDRNKPWLREPRLCRKCHSMRLKHPLKDGLRDA